MQHMSPSTTIQPLIEPQTLISPSITFVWLFSRLFRLILLSAPISVLSAPLLTSIFNWKMMVAVLVVYWIYALTLTFIWPFFEYRYFRYDIREHDICIQQGVLFRRITAIPLHRIQHVDTHQGPIERMLGVSSLLLYTASGVYADGIIYGLDNDIAQNLRDALSKRGSDDGV